LTSLQRSSPIVSSGLEKKVILSHSGKQHSYHVAKALDELGRLERFYTSSYVQSKWLQNWIGRTNNAFWSRRFLKGLYGTHVEANWPFALKEMIFSKVYGMGTKMLNAVYERDERFDWYMAGRIPRLKGDIFWGFQGSCLQSLKAAKANGKLAICELATAHAPSARRILEEEKNLHPEWADSIDNVNFPAAYFDRLCEEPHQADIVIGASEFTLQTLRDDGVEDSKLRRLPLGFEIAHIPFHQKEAGKCRPVRLLFAGRITQRKGIKYLLDAMLKFNPLDVELHVIGHVHGSGKILKAYNNFIIHPHLHHNELLKMYGEFDLFALPSVFEGFGLVILEAMAAGVPVITTPHTIGPELIEDNSNGYIVPIRDVNAIVNSIKNYLEKDDDQRQAMRLKAREGALRFTWESYKIRLSAMMPTLYIS
jgi:alpha-maltose-1-phosphate synthase